MAETTQLNFYSWAPTVSGIYSAMVKTVVETTDLSAYLQGGGPYRDGRDNPLSPLFVLRQSLQCHQKLKYDSISTANSKSAVLKYLVFAFFPDHSAI